MNGSITDIAKIFASFALIAILKTTILLILSAIVARVLKRTSAASRHLVWAAALAGALLVLTPSPMLPVWNVDASPVQKTLASPLSNRYENEAIPMPAKLADVSVLVNAKDNIQVQTPNINLSQQSVRHFSFVDIAPCAAMFVWLFGALALLGQLCFGAIQIQRLRRCASIPNDRIIALAESVSAQMKVRRVPEVLVASAPYVIGAPVTWGAVRPTVLLPIQAEEWSDDFLRAALVHEYAHIGRFDWLSQIAGRIVCATYWFYPPIHWAAKLMRLESERACDDAVLRSGFHFIDYAQQLVSVAQAMSVQIPPTIGSALLRPSEIEQRLKDILDKQRNRSPLSRKLVFLIGAIAVAIVIPLAVLRVNAETTGNLIISPSDEAKYGIVPVGQQEEAATVALGHYATLPNGYKVWLLAIGEGEVNRLKRHKLIVRSITIDNDGMRNWSDETLGSQTIPPSKKSIQTDRLLSNQTVVSQTRLSYIRALRQYNQLMPSFFRSAALAINRDTSNFAATIPELASHLAGDHDNDQWDSVCLAFIHIAPPPGAKEVGAISEFSEVLDQSKNSLYSPAHHHTCITKDSDNGFSKGSSGVSYPNPDPALVEYKAPKSNLSSTVRFGIASGKWKTVAVIPISSKSGDVSSLSRVPSLLADESIADDPQLQYSDSRNKTHILRFLPLGKKLSSHFARRIVAVDKNGKEYWTGFSFEGSPNSFWDIDAMKEYRLEVRPYDVVEFDHVR